MNPVKIKIMKNPSPILSAILPLSLAVLMFAGCATSRPPRQPGRSTSSTGRITAPPEPVMPPAYQGGQQTLPPPQVVSFETVKPGTALPPPAASVSLQPRKGTSYTIRKGESLSAIAARNQMSWRELAAYNYITDPNKIRVGQVILIPSKGGSTPAAPVRTVTPPAAPAASGSTYVVQSGDSLSVIAQRNGTSVAALKSANGLSSDRLLVGQILKLPAGSGAAPAASVSETAAPTPVPTRPIPTPRPVLDTPEFQSPVTPPEAPVVEDMDVLSDDPVVSKAFPIVVQEGDTLESIANNYIVPVEEIRKLNKLPDNAEVTPGQKLQIPPSVY